MVDPSTTDAMINHRRVTETLTSGSDGVVVVIGGESIPESAYGNTGRGSAN